MRVSIPSLCSLVTLVTCIYAASLGAEPEDIIVPVRALRPYSAALEIPFTLPFPERDMSELKCFLTVVLG